jgi:hypothetical protein
MDEHRVPKRLLEMMKSGRRPRGRPCTQWIDQVERDVERRGWDCSGVDEMQELADRDSWKLLHKSRPTSVEMT